MNSKVVELEYPETLAAAMNLSADEFAREAKLALAVKLFELGRLTSGQAARLAGISRLAFLLECPRFGAASVSWDDEELAAEFDHL